MTDAFLVGLTLVLVGGLAQGAFMAPMKWIRGWEWENSWLIFAVTAYLAAPWLLAWLTIPRLGDIYAGISKEALISAIVFGSAWGVGALTFGLGVEALGMALGFTLILGVATCVGTLIPLAFSSHGSLDSRQVLLTCLCLAVILAGVVLSSFAGKWKESDTRKVTHYRRGILLCATSGVLSSCGNLGLSFAGSITQRALSLGVPESIAPNAVWTLLTVPLFLCNFGYALYRLKNNSSGANFRARQTPLNLVLAILMGLLWMGGLSLYGYGVRKLGPMGISWGFAIFMSSTVVMACTIGIVTGEWRKAPAEAKFKMGVGIALLVLAICCLATFNRAS